MINLKSLQNKNGFTLVEVLLSMTLLTLIAIPMLSYFYQAYTYTNQSQDKTIAVNVARNVMNYMEKQNFVKLKNYLDPDTAKLAKLDGGSCDDPDSATSFIFNNGNEKDIEICNAVLQPNINNIPYKDKISIYLTSYYGDKDLTNKISQKLQQKPVPDDLLNQVEQIITDSIAGGVTVQFEDQLLQVYVVVNWHEQRGNIVLEGMITDEALR